SIVRKSQSAPRVNEGRTANTMQPSLTLVSRRGGQFPPALCRSAPGNAANPKRQSALFEDVALGDEHRQFPGHPEYDGEQDEEHQQARGIRPALEQVGNPYCGGVTNQDKRNKNQNGTHGLAFPGSRK